jgi:hypothetical protein
LLVESFCQPASMTAKSGRMPDFHDRAGTSFRRGEFVRVAGSPGGYSIERKLDTRHIDHLTILVRAGVFGTIEIALNTYSLRSLNAGHNPRIRVGVLSSHGSALPPAGVSRSGGLNYSALEAKNRIAYRELERKALESLLIEKLGRAALVEGWVSFMCVFIREFIRSIAAAPAARCQRIILGAMAPSAFTLNKMLWRSCYSLNSAGNLREGRTPSRPSRPSQSGILESRC